jgi:hypothetical protein
MKGVGVKEEMGEVARSNEPVSVWFLWCCVRNNIANRLVRKQRYN